MTTFRNALAARWTEAFLAFLYLCATLQFVRYYSKTTTLYLNMSAYLHGHERLPFQERVFPILFIRPLVDSQWVAHHLVHSNGMYTADRGPLYILSLCGLLIAGFFVQKLYYELSPERTLQFLVYPLFLFAIMWSYSIHNEANFSYPYDFLSVAFFAAGIYFIYMRRFLPLILIMLIGTTNRETTLFLIGIYVIDQATNPHAGLRPSLQERFALSRVPWLRVALLFCIWAAIKMTLVHYFLHNDPSENYVRISENIGRLKPRLWPALLNICGYMLPIVFVLRQYLRPARFANYLFIFPVWFAAMFYTGVIVETRIYGELCSFVAVALTLIIERYLKERSAQKLGVASHEESEWALQHNPAA